MTLPKNQTHSLVLTGIKHEPISSNLGPFYQGMLMLLETSSISLLTTGSFGGNIGMTPVVFSGSNKWGFLSQALRPPEHQPWSQRLPALCPPPLAFLRHCLGEGHMWAGQSGGASCKKEVGLECDEWEGRT